MIQTLLSANGRRHLTCARLHCATSGRLSLPLRAPAAARPTPPAAASQSQSYSFQRTGAMAPEFRAGRMAEVDKGVRAQWAQSTMVGQFLVCKGAHATEDAGTFEVYGDEDQAKARATELSQDPSSATPAHCVRTLSDIPLERVKKAYHEPRAAAGWRGDAGQPRRSEAYQRDLPPRGERSVHQDAHRRRHRQA